MMPLKCNFMGFFVFDFVCNIVDLLLCGWSFIFCDFNIFWFFGNCQKFVLSLTVQEGVSDKNYCKCPKIKWAEKLRWVQRQLISWPKLPWNYGWRQWLHGHGQKYGYGQHFSRWLHSRFDIISNDFGAKLYCMYKIGSVGNDACVLRYPISPAKQSLIISAA